MVAPPRISSLDLLLRALDPDLETAADKYELLRLKITKLFCWKGCPESRADELADITLDRVAEKISGGEDVRSINSYAAGVARFVYLEYSRKNVIDAVGDDLPEATAPPEQLLNTEEDIRLACLRRCLAEVAPGDDDRRLIIGYYDPDAGDKNKDSRRRLAESLGLTVNAMKVRACRLRAKLERCINDCVYAVTKSPPRNTIDRGER